MEVEHRPLWRKETPEEDLTVQIRVREAVLQRQQMNTVLRPRLAKGKQASVTTETLLTA